MNTQVEDFEWFVENYKQLFEEFGAGFLVIKNKEVIGRYDSFGEAVNKTKEKEKDGTFIVQENNGTEDAFNEYIPSLNLFATIEEAKSVISK